MMTWSCDKCGRWISAPESMIDRQVECPACRGTNIVPQVQLSRDPEQYIRPSMWNYADQVVIVRTIALGIAVGGILSAIAFWVFAAMMSG
ncbi:MAG: hypothetical protein IT430_11590 [Phycisphaerales bacterium]|nr:hypothetical protein [Phycisphaerales bacterium]